MSLPGISSTASVQQAATTLVPVVSDDPAWKYCTQPDLSKRQSLKCNFCDKICTSGVTRIKWHLSCIKNNNVAPCKKVPKDVKKEMIVLLLKMDDAKDKKCEALEKLRNKVNLDHSDGEETDEDISNEVVVLTSKPKSSSSKGGPIEKFYKSSIEESVKKNGKKVQTQISTQKREERRDRACEYICQFFYEASIPHNTVTLPSFACMLEAIGDFGTDMRGPSAYEMSGPFLQKSKRKVMDTFKNHKETWELTGCTVMTDAWTFWKLVDVAVNFFEPLAIVLRRMDSDVPSMGFFYGCMVDAKKEILLRFDNDESRCKSVLDIIDNRWDNKLKKPLHLAGYFLNPYYYYPNKVQIERDGKFRAAVITCITTLIEKDEDQDDCIEEIKLYQAQLDSFGTAIATRQRKNKLFDPATWWLNYGTCAPKLKDLAVKILSLTCSSSACERNFSAFEQVHAKKRSRLLSGRLRDLVFVKFNSRMQHMKDNKIRDPIEKIIDDVLEDETNEFITGIVRKSIVQPEQAEPDIVTPEPEASTSQAQAKGKRQAKKRKKSIHSILNSVEEEAVLSDSSSSESEGNQAQDDDMLSDSSQSASD